MREGFFIPNIFLKFATCNKSNWKMKIHTAKKDQAADIAQLIMMAMTDECCLYFTGDGQTTDDFRRTMTRLVEMEESQYSYTNTLVAETDEGRLMGVCVSYDGGKLHQLREAFVNAAKEDFGRDFSDIDDETQAGELYLDSLAVYPEYRGRGVASSLLRASAEKAKGMGLPAAGLLVDKGNPNAERLYLRIGFEYVDDAVWGGHAMKHLQYKV